MTRSMSMSSQGEAPPAAAAAAQAGEAAASSPPAAAAAQAGEAAASLSPAFQFVGAERDEDAEDETAQKGDEEHDEEESEESDDEDDDDDEKEGGEDDDDDDDDDDDEEAVEPKKAGIPKGLCAGDDSVMVRSWCVEKAVRVVAGGGNAKVVLEVTNVAPGQNVLHVQSLVKVNDPTWTVSVESLTMGGKDKQGHGNMWPTTPGKVSNKFGVGPRTVIRTENAVDGDGNALTPMQVAEAVHGPGAVICKVPYTVLMGCAVYASTVHGTSPIKWVDGFLDELDEVHQRKHKMSAEAWALKEGRRLFEQLVCRAKSDVAAQARSSAVRKTTMKKKGKKVAPKKRTKKPSSAARGKAKATEVAGGAAPSPPTKKGATQTVLAFATPQEKGETRQNALVSPSQFTDSEEDSVKVLSFNGVKAGSAAEDAQLRAKEDAQMKATLAQSLMEAQMMERDGDDDVDMDNLDRGGGNSGVDEVKDMMRQVVAGLGEMRAENKMLAAKVEAMSVRIGQNEQWASVMATRDEAAEPVGGAAAAASADEKVTPCGAQEAPRGAAAKKPCGAKKVTPCGADDEEPYGAAMGNPRGDTKTPRGVNGEIAVSPAFSPPAGGGRMHVADLGGRQGDEDDAAHALEAPLTARVCVLRGVNAAEDDPKGNSHVSRGATQRAFTAAVAAGLGWPNGSVRVDAHVFVSQSNYSSVIVKIDPVEKNALKMWPMLMTGRRLDVMNKMLCTAFNREDAAIVWYLPREAKTSWAVERGCVALTKSGLAGMSHDQIRGECKKHWPLGPPFRSSGAQQQRRR